MKTTALVDELKKELKKRGVTYAELGKRVGLSEAAVKRAFALRNFSLAHLDQFCEAVDVELRDLMLSGQREEKRARHFSEEVEDALAADPELLLALYLLLLGSSESKVRQTLKLDKARFYKLARSLEALGLVDVMPGDQVRPKVRKSVRWLPGGALARNYASAIKAEFFNSSFDGEFEHHDFLTGSLAPDSYALMKRKILAVFKEFDDLTELDGATREADAKGFWLYCCIRPWDPVAVIRRHGNESASIQAGR